VAKSVRECAFTKQIHLSEKVLQIRSMYDIEKHRLTDDSFSINYGQYGPSVLLMRVHSLIFIARQ